MQFRIEMRMSGLQFVFKYKEVEIKKNTIHKNQCNLRVLVFEKGMRGAFSSSRPQSWSLVLNGARKTFPFLEPNRKRLYLVLWILENRIYEL